MIYAAATALTIVNILWLASTLITLPGNWLMVATACLAAWWQRDAGMFSPWTLVAAGGLAAAGEVVEFLASAVGVRRAGGTRWGGVGSLVGAVIGLAIGTIVVPVPVLGSLLGASGGAIAGTLLLELAAGRRVKHAFKPSLAAGAGRLAGTLLKFAIGVVIWLVIAVAAFWP